MIGILNDHTKGMRAPRTPEEIAYDKEMATDPDIRRASQTVMDIVSEHPEMIEMYERRVRFFNSYREATANRKLQARELQNEARALRRKADNLDIKAANLLSRPSSMKLGHRILREEGKLKRKLIKRVSDQLASNCLKEFYGRSETPKP
jgi:hypothetical protein